MRKETMNYYSTKNKNTSRTFRDAVLNGIADDGGLYLPEEFPHLSQDFIDNVSSKSMLEIAYEVSRNFIDDIPDADLLKILQKTLTFDAPLVSLSDKRHILELFHGPTLAFKDFGARFLANIMSWYNKDENKELIILVATSGDTGSAVAQGFYGIEGIKVGLLYPSGMVSEIQEKQLTTIGGNVQAFEVQGTFDDCQGLVKQGFADADLKDKFTLSSANSINIARLLPQSFYYFRAYGQLQNPSPNLRICVPSGNFGNLTAGLMARAMGLPVDKFIAAVNANRSFPDYLQSGEFTARKAVATLSNAMDVGNPSNFDRIYTMFNGDRKAISHVIESVSVTDDETIGIIKEVYEKYQYIIDPHGAVGYKAAEELAPDTETVIFETAHPAKFLDTVKNALNIDVEIPRRLAEQLHKKKSAMQIAKDFEAFKDAVFDVF
jgi:threonine synthase